MGSRKGFTVIELLIVVALIAILVSILIPVVNSLSRTEKQTICASNVHQIVAAGVVYAAQYNGQLIIPYVAWPQWCYTDFKTGAIWPYLSDSIQTRQQIIRCPADTFEQNPTLGGADLLVPHNFSYSINNNLSSSQMRLAQVHNPSAHVLLYEEFAPNDAACYGPTDSDDWLTGRHGGSHTAEHRALYGDTAWSQEGSGNVGFFDGHVELMTVKAYFTAPYYHFGPLTQ